MTLLQYEKGIEVVLPKISVIFPAYNEEENVGHVLRGVSDSLKEAGYDYELILVDDGSTDKTSEVAADLHMNPHLRIVGYPHNRGKGHAIKYGSRYASGDYVVFMDSDSDIHLRRLEPYLEKNGDADLVIASKRHPQSSVKQPLVRKFLSLGFHTLVKLLTGVRVSDTQSGLKVFRKEAIEKMMPFLSVKRFAFDVEVLTVAHLLKMKIVELPIDIQLNANFKIKEMVRMLVDVLGITYRLRVKRWYQTHIRNSDTSYKPIIRW